MSAESGQEAVLEPTEPVERRRLCRNLWLAALLVPTSLLVAYLMMMPTRAAAASAVVTAILIGFLALIGRRLRADGSPRARTSSLVGMAVGASVGAWSPPALMAAADLPMAPMAFELFFIIGAMLSTAGPALPIGGFLAGWVVGRWVERRRRKRLPRDARIG